LISHLQERSEFDLELVLTSTSDLVVMVLHSHTSVSQQRGDLIAQIIRAVLRRRGVVTLLISDLVAKLIGLSRVDLAPFL
jgi:citrate lyase gamma subunit